MRAWRIESFGLEQLKLAELPTPQPGPGEVLVKVRAVSYNYRDLLMVKGHYNPKLELPRIPCSDGTGEVEAVGANVSDWNPGDRVAGIFMQNWQDGVLNATKSKGALGGDIDGMLAEHVALSSQGLVKIPQHLSYQEAATLPCAAVTAWNALKVSELRPGSTVLIQGTGGVSVFALQFALQRGLRVLAVSSGDEKLDRLRTMGLDAGINYLSHPEWEKWALDQTGGEGVDLVVEVGGAGTLPRSLRAIRYGGTIAQIGVLGGAAEPIAIPQILHKQARIQGIYVGSRADFEEMNRAIALSQLRPVGENFNWTQAPEVLKRMEQGSHFGKLVLTVE